MMVMTNAIGDRKVTLKYFGLKRGSLHNFLAHRFPGLLLHKTLLCSYIIPNFGQTCRGVPIRYICDILWKFLQSKQNFGSKGDCDVEGAIVLFRRIQALCSASHFYCTCHKKTNLYILHGWNVKKHIYAWKVVNSWMIDMKVTAGDFRLKCSSATRISALVHPALMAWQNLKTPWLHNFLPPSGKNDESYQASVLDDTECEYFPSKHNVSTCLERHTLTVKLHCIPYISIVIFHRSRLYILE